METHTVSVRARGVARGDPQAIAALEWGLGNDPGLRRPVVVPDRISDAVTLTAGVEALSPALARRVAIVAVWQHLVASGCLRA
ncbi:MAG: hypothetical protein AB1416_07760 [Actinomycetota bacterium]